MDPIPRASFLQFSRVKSESPTYDFDIKTEKREDLQLDKVTRKKNNHNIDYKRLGCHLGFHFVYHFVRIELVLLKKN